MLCLSRKRYERIIIRIPGQPDIAVQWVEQEQGKVRFGFEADPQVLILREELLGEERRAR